MSRFITRKEDGTIIEEIESMELCKWRVNEVCCNDKCDCLGDYPYPSSICEDKWACGCFEKEDGIIVMESFDLIKKERIEKPKKVIKFLNEIDNTCKKYNFSISHEDSHGAFIIEKYDEYNIDWLKHCQLNYDKE